MEESETVIESILRFSICPTDKITRERRIFDTVLTRMRESLMLSKNDSFPSLAINSNL